MSLEVNGFYMQQVNNESDVENLSGCMIVLESRVVQDSQKFFGYVTQHKINFDGIMAYGFARTSSLSSSLPRVAPLSGDLSLLHLWARVATMQEIANIQQALKEGSIQFRFPDNITWEHAVKSHSRVIDKSAAV